jgi:hypothetical protein
MCKIIGKRSKLAWYSILPFPSASAKLHIRSKSASGSPRFSDTIPAVKSALLIVLTSEDPPFFSLENALNAASMVWYFSMRRDRTGAKSSSSAEGTHLATNLIVSINASGPCGPGPDSTPLDFTIDSATSPGREKGGEVKMLVSAAEEIVELSPEALDRIVSISSGPSPPSAVCVFTRMDILFRLSPRHGHPRIICTLIRLHSF